MSEERGNSIKRWHKAWPTILYSSFLLCIIAFVIFISVGQVYKTDINPAYYSVKDEIQTAVTYYKSINNESLPISNSTYTNANCSDCYVINISALLVTNDGLLASTPDGLHLSASGNDNCGGNASLGCVNGWHYIWIVDNDGTVFSYCAGAGCTTNNSGYQDVYP